jgi:enoyl-CoA hydratase/carnithine racemase
MTMGIRYNSEDLVATIVIDRPEALNAFDDALTEELVAAWARFDASADRVAVITGGESRHFTVGADLKRMPADVWRAVPGMVAPLRKPVIAAIRGHSVGLGVAIVQACDLCVAAAGAKLLYSEPKVGLAYGLITGLAARVPHKFAMEMMLCGKAIDVERAERMGLVNAVVPAGTEVDVALGFAKEIAKAAPKVVRWLKQGVDGGVLRDGPTAHALRTMTAIGKMEDSQDFAEGRAAFIEKRPPEFKDN